jgi:predicted RND superfamily exporter protein
MNNENEFVTFIKEQRDILQRSPIKDSAFVYGPITTFWAVFTELDSYLHILLGIGTGIIFICALLFFSFDIVTAVITSASCLMIVLEIYGFAVYCFNFNVFVAAVCLMALGLSVEFTAHLAAAFSLGSGTVAERLVNAMAHTFPALIEGTVSTFLSIVPLAFHTVPFAVKYLFWIVFMVVVVGFVNGALFMPSLLSLLSSILSLGGCGLRRNESDSEGSARKPVAGSASTRGDEAGADQLPTIMQPSSQDNRKPPGAASA